MRSSAERVEHVKTFIANFGTENWAWKNCLERSSIAVMDDMRVHPHWQRGDREGYIAEAQEKLISRMGRPVARQAASRWFNLNTILMETVGDIWIHREKDELSWTTSLGQAPESEIVDDPQYHSERVKIIVYYKRCDDWSNKTRKGGKLPPWAGIHPKAREFLFTEGTFQQLSADNSLSAQALINGESLSEWHQRPDWRAKEDRSGRGAGVVFNPLELTAARMLLDLTAERMAETAQATAAQSGQISVVIKKEKKFLFYEQRELESPAQNELHVWTGLVGLKPLPGLGESEVDRGTVFRSLPGRRMLPASRRFSSVCRLETGIT